MTRFYSAKHFRVLKQYTIKHAHNIDTHYLFDVPYNNEYYNMLADLLDDEHKINIISIYSLIDYGEYYEYGHNIPENKFIIFVKILNQMVFGE